MLLEVIIIGLNIGYLTSDTEDNELYTPAFAVDPIIKYLPKDKIMWLPFDDEWSMFYQRLTEECFKVIRSSLSEGKDFFPFLLPVLFFLSYTAATYGSEYIKHPVSHSIIHRSIRRHARFR